MVFFICFATFIIRNIRGEIDLTRVDRNNEWFFVEVLGSVIIFISCVV